MAVDDIEMLKISIVKRAFLISLIIQTVSVCWIFFLVSKWGGHSALTFGMLLQFPASMAGVLLGELLQSCTGYGAVSVTVAIMITILLQLLILSMITYFILKKRHKL